MIITAGPPKPGTTAKESHGGPAQGRNGNQKRYGGPAQEGGEPFYRWLIDNDYPTHPRLQALCAPCNQSKGDRPQCLLVHLA
jgi:hypothetical protein